MLKRNVEIIHITEENEIVVCHKKTGNIYREKVRKIEADIYRKELQQVRVIETVINPSEREQFFEQAILIN